MSRIIAATLFVLALVPSSAFALITGGVGNKPMTGHGWPVGAEAVFNDKGRVAWWEGPPFGGGQYHAECRGDAKALSTVLADFAKIEVKSKKVILHDGTGHSFWLAPNGEKEKLKDAQVDWVFMIWRAESWSHLHKLPAGLNPTAADDDSPPSTIDVFTGNLKWSDVVVPPGLRVVDNRLEAHGFKATDGDVIQGLVIDLETKKPLAATVQFQRIESQTKGGYKYTVVREMKTDASGKWVSKNTPTDWLRIVVLAEGYVPRLGGYLRGDDQPGWQMNETSLARAVAASGKVSDDAGAPLKDVNVRFDDMVAAAGGGHYESPDGFEFKTDENGNFRATAIPAGKANIWIHKAGYMRPGLGSPVTTPANDIALTMSLSAQVDVTIDFGDRKRTGDYMVSIAPFGGEKVGSYGGSGNIDAKNKISFKDVPPGKYTFIGRPNPGSLNDTAEPVTIDLKGGKTEAITIKAK